MGIMCILLPSEASIQQIHKMVIVKKIKGCAHEFRVYKTVLVDYLFLTIPVRCALLNIFNFHLSVNLKVVAIEEGEYIAREDVIKFELKYTVERVFFFFFSSVS